MWLKLRAWPSDTPPLLLVLDGVTDVHNFGACLRSADASGAHGVIVAKDKAAPLNATVRKVACGAAEVVPVYQVTNLARTLAGRSPGIPLAERGYAQARALAERLAEQPIVELVSSPLLRCKQTLAPLAERLGRMTGWHAVPWGEAGSGQHLWSLSTGDEVGLLSVRSLAFA